LVAVINFSRGRHKKFGFFLKQREDETMFLPDANTLVNHEQYRDRLRQMEHLQLLRRIEQPGLGSKVYQKIVSWLGTQLVNWGTKLQGPQNPDTGCQEASLKMSITVH